ncbi:MAG TPA: YegS/Rv2252/BmrU family lipid kinase [Acidimicrobiia bacterium]|nr:YegS/Rv2252/BmrU family lipid kinase [Acidimicrobiia bacterium]
MGARWVVVANPAAGKRPIQMSRVRAALIEAGIEADFLMPSDVTEMKQALAEAVTAERLALVGGDGTVNQAVNVLLERERERLPILGVLPAGTGCDLLRTFGIPQDVEGAAHHLRGDAVYVIDVGELSGTWGTRRFANVAQAGVGAAAVATAGRLSRRLGSQRYLVSFGIRLPGFPATEIELTTERRTYRGRALAVIMANAQFFAGGWNIAPKAMLVDGAFDLQVLNVPKTSAPALVPKIMRGLHLTEKGVRRISAPSFRLETDLPWPVEVDGDFLGNTPVDGQVLPAAIQLKI